MSDVSQEDIDARWVKLLRRNRSPGPMNFGGACDGYALLGFGAIQHLPTGPRVWRRCLVPVFGWIVRTDSVRGVVRPAIGGGTVASPFLHLLEEPLPYRAYMNVGALSGMSTVLDAKLHDKLDAAVALLLHEMLEHRSPPPCHKLLCTLHEDCIMSAKAGHYDLPKLCAKRALETIRDAKKEPTYTLCGPKDMEHFTQKAGESWTLSPGKPLEGLIQRPWRTWPLAKPVDLGVDHLGKPATKPFVRRALPPRRHSSPLTEPHTPQETA